MGKWLDLAAKLEAGHDQDNRDGRAESPDLAPNVPKVPIVPPAASLSASHVALLKQWRAGLSTLGRSPRHGIASDRWERLVRDAVLLFNAWGRQSVALGWTERDLFGVHPSLRPNHQALHGLAWRCDGFRVIALTEHSAALEGKASRTPSRYYRGDVSALVPLWALQ